MGDWFHQQAGGGSLVLAVPVALIAGLVSFFSPCVIPLLPGYLSYATGLSGVDLGQARRGRMLLGSFLFVAGFTVFYVLVGRALGAFSVIRRHQQWVTRLGGVMLVLVGIALLTGWWDQSVAWLQIHLVGIPSAPI